MIEATKQDPQAESTPAWRDQRISEIKYQEEILAKKHADAYSQPLPEPYNPNRGIDATASNPEPQPVAPFVERALQSIAERTDAHNKRQEEAKASAKKRAEQTKD
jgi:hypothetical protein